MASGSGSRALVLLLLTSAFLITGLLFDYMPMIVDDQIKRKVELATNEEIRSYWTRPPVDFDSYYWLYDILNAESRVEKRVLELSANKYKIVYNSTRHYHFNESIGPPMANSMIDEPLTLLNPIYPSMAEGTRVLSATMDPSIRPTIAVSVNRLAERFNESLFRNTSAREALLGRKLAMLETVKKMAATFGVSAMNIPDIAPNNIFGYVSVRNGTYSGPFEVYTGYEASMGSLGDIISYQGKRRLTEFQGRCNRLQASAGELRPMPIGPNQILEMYMPPFCRIVHLKPTGMRKLREGLAISYVMAPEDLMSAEVNPDNKCFCLNTTTDDYCSLNGVIELAPCSYFSPILVHLPHVELDPRITSTIHDWQPELIDSDVEVRPPANKSSQMLILRRIGVPIQADITVIMFMKVTRDPAFRQTANVPKVSYIPLLMARETAAIPPKLAQIILNLESFLALTYHIKVVMYLSAIVLLCWLSGHYYGRFSTHRADRVVPSGRGSAGPGGGPAGSGGATETVGMAAAAVGASVINAQAADSMASGRGSIAGRLPRQTIAGGDSLSERANSADSSRSQPPSRASRSSIEGADSGGSKQSTEAAATGSGLTRTAKFFSKVDDQRAGELGSDKKINDDEDDNERAMENGGNLENEADPSGGAKCRRRRRNWFGQVFSNFVRMLNGLRTTISDASQLNLSENDYQDKQLEMLAGKIDNWYNGQEETTSTGNDQARPTSATNELIGEETKAAGSGTEGAPFESMNKNKGSVEANSDGGELSRDKRSAQVDQIDDDGKLKNGDASTAGQPGEASSGKEAGEALTKSLEREGSSLVLQSKKDETLSLTESKDKMAANNGGDTSGDDDRESFTGSSLISSEDKAAAFEQMEAAMSKQARSLGGQSSAEAESGEKLKDKQQQGNGINSSTVATKIIAQNHHSSGSQSTNTSIESVVIAPNNKSPLTSIKTSLPPSNNDNNKSDELVQTSPKDGAHQMRPNDEPNQSGPSNDASSSSQQMAFKQADGNRLEADESSRLSEQTKQSNKWQASDSGGKGGAPNRLVTVIGRQAATTSDVETLPAQAEGQQEGDLRAPNEEPKLSSPSLAKDERRDSGVKLDSRNGINGTINNSTNSGEPKTTTTTTIEVKQAAGLDKSSSLSSSSTGPNQNEALNSSSEQSNVHEPSSHPNAVTISTQTEPEIMESPPMRGVAQLTMNGFGNGAATPKSAIGSNNIMQKINLAAAN